MRSDGAYYWCENRSYYKGERQTALWYDIIGLVYVLLWSCKMFGYRFSTLLLQSWWFNEAEDFLSCANIDME